MDAIFSKWYIKKDYYIPSFNSKSTRVMPNLSLSVAEIFDRWKKNLPIDTIMRNGEFLPKDMSDEDAFNTFDDTKVDDITDEGFLESLNPQKLTSELSLFNSLDNENSDAASDPALERGSAAGDTSVTSNAPSHNQEQ